MDNTTDPQIDGGWYSAGARPDGQYIEAAASPNYVSLRCSHMHGILVVSCATWEAFRDAIRQGHYSIEALRIGPRWEASPLRLLSELPEPLELPRRPRTDQMFGMRP